jgi:uncharacterized protein (TIRG00374 family)
MSKLKKSLWSLARLGIGITIVALLLHSVNRNSSRVEFKLDADLISPQPPELSLDPDSVYVVVSGNTTNRFKTLDLTDEGILRTLPTTRALSVVPVTGTLELELGRGPEILEYVDLKITNGLSLLGESFRTALTRWPALAAGVGTFFICLCLCVIRWHMILKVQGLHLPWKRTWSIFFIGHFFNAFMFGATGGDLIKALYTARETGHQKTEAVTTVFIDRAVGLLGLLILTTVTMLARLRFFLEHPETRYAMFLVFAAMSAAVAGLVLMFATRRLLARSALFRRLSQTAAGRIFLRVYESFYLCLSHPSLLARTLAISLTNHVMITVMVFFLGTALAINLSYLDYLSLAPTINAISAIPITPGGLGLREYACVVYLGVVGVTAVKALPMSIMVYATMLVWSVFGGLVFLLNPESSTRDAGQHDVPDSL